MHEQLFITAERLLPKYGGIAQFALFQATLLHEELPPDEELNILFEEWLKAREKNREDWGNV